MGPKVFLSYSQADFAAAQYLAGKLRSAGVDPWLFELQATPEADWSSMVEEAIQGCQSCLVIAGPDPMGPWLNQEIPLVLQRRNKDAEFRVIPVLLPNAGKTSVPTLLTELAWIEFAESLDDVIAFDRVLQAIFGQPQGGTRRLKIPDIAWVEIPAGPFIYQQGETRELPTFWIAKYPITNIQYQCFIDDDGYQDERWRSGLQKPEPTKSTWPHSNRPRTDVDWYEAVAYTRWLAYRLGVESTAIRLPTEIEWEKAARGDQGLNYPWGNEYRSGFANIDETWGESGQWNLGQTTAVGMYRQGRSPYGADDLSGTVWEWCLNEYDDPDAAEFAPSDVPRALRGGAWYFNSGYARADYRNGSLPDVRGSFRGFRVLSSVPIALR